MQKRKTFTPEFKREAVRLLEQGDRTSSALSQIKGAERLTDQGVRVEWGNQGVGALEAPQECG